MELLDELCALHEMVRKAGQRVASTSAVQLERIVLPLVHTTQRSSQLGGRTQAVVWEVVDGYQSQACQRKQCRALTGVSPRCAYPQLSGSCPSACPSWLTSSVGSNITFILVSWGIIDPVLAPALPLDASTSLMGWALAAIVIADTWHAGAVSWRVRVGTSWSVLLGLLLLRVNSSRRHLAEENRTLNFCFSLFCRRSATAMSASMRHAATLACGRAVGVPMCCQCDARTSWKLNGNEPLYTQGQEQVQHLLAYNKNGLPQTRRGRQWGSGGLRHL